jgi:preprotein translocase subunit SecA
MNRANELVTGGHQLRDTQILSVLAFLMAEKNQGKLYQIHTGEGKTTIVSLLSTLKSLRGEKVDIITSNQVLAAEGVKNRESFYGLFGISVATNNPNESYIQGPRQCYTADVVYGSIGNFQFDYLKDSFEGLETRSKRGFGSVILDEVDSMLIDNGGYIAKLAEPFPGIDSLKHVYIEIWQELCKAEQNLCQDFEKNYKRKQKN